MADESRELEIKITTTADVGGVKQAEEAVKGLTSAAGNAAHGSGELGKEVKELGHHFHEAAGAGRVVAEVLHGNIGALGHLGVAVKTIGTLLKTNLIGTLVTLGAVAAQVILPIIQGFDQTKKKIEDAAKASEQLAKTNMDSLARGLGVAGEAADELRKKFDAANASKERLDNAEKAARLAEVRANTKLSEVDKAKAEFSINEEFRVRDERRKIDSEKNKVTIAEQGVRSANEDALAPQRDLEEAIKSNNAVKALDAKFKEFKNLSGLIASGSAAPGEAARFAELAKDQELKDLDAPTPESLARAAKRVEEALPATNAAERRKVAAESALRDAKFGLENEESVQARQLGFTKREQAADLKGAVNAARAKDQERVGGFRSAQDKVTQSKDDQARLQQELRQLEEQQQRRTGLSSDPANADIADAIAKKKEEIRAAAGQTVAAQSAFTNLTKEAPKGLLAEAQKPALDAAIQKSKDDKETQAVLRELVGAIKENTAAVKGGGAAPPAQPADAQSSPIARSGRSGSINGVATADALAAVRAARENGDPVVVANVLDKNAAAQSSLTDVIVKKVSRNTEQILNQREQVSQ